MRIRIVGSSFALSLALLAVGCGKEENKPTTPPTPPGVDATKIQAPELNDVATNAVLSADVQKSAQEKIDIAVTYIKADKLDLAEKTVSALETQKASLPMALQTKIDDVRKMLDTAKKASDAGIKIPGT